MARAVYDSVLEDCDTTGSVDGAFTRVLVCAVGVLEIPAIALLVEVDLGGVVTLVEIF